MKLLLCGIGYLFGGVLVGLIILRAFFPVDQWSKEYLDEIRREEGKDDSQGAI